MSSGYPVPVDHLGGSEPAEVAFELTAGQLMGVATRSARQLLGRSGTGDGASLVAGWSPVLDAAAEILDATEPATRADRATALRAGFESGPGMAVGSTVATVSQLRLEAQAFGAGAVTAPLHPDLLRVVEVWEQTAALLRRPAHQHTESPATVAATVTGTLTVIVHAAGLRLAGRTGEPGPLDREAVDGFLRMSERHEQLLLRAHRQLVTSLRPTREPPASHPSSQPDTGVSATAVTTTDAANRVTESSPAPPAASSSRPTAVKNPPELADRFATCLEQWAPLAILSATDPLSSIRDLTRIAQTEVGSTWAAGALIAAAGHRGELPSRSVRHLMDRFQTLSEHWRWTAGQWGWVRRYGAHEPSAAVLDGANTLTAALTDAALTEATYSQPTGRSTRGFASPATISARLAGAEIMPLVQELAANSAILAEVYQRLPARIHRHDASGRLRPALFAPERVLQRIAQQEHERDQQRLRPGSRVSADQLTVPVSSVRGDKLLALTTEAAWLLRTIGDDLVGAATRADQAINAILDPWPTPARPAAGTVSARHRTTGLPLPRHQPPPPTGPASTPGPSI